MKLTTFLTFISCGVVFSVTCFAADSNKSTLNDQQFVQIAAQADMLEAHLAQMAEHQSSRKGVEDFGESTALDDTMNYQTLCSIAKKLDLTVPNAVNSDGDKLNFRTGQSKWKKLRPALHSGRVERWSKDHRRI